MAWPKAGLLCSGLGREGASLILGCPIAELILATPVFRRPLILESKGIEAYATLIPKGGEPKDGLHMSFRTGS